MAGVRSHPSVVQNMFLQLCTARERLTTLVADVGSYSCVYPHVKRDLTGHGEAFLADGAFVRSLPSVCSPVDLQLSCGAEGLAAVRAEERFLPRVSPDVYRQVSVHREPLGAVGTLVRPLAGVSPHVELQVSFAPEGLSTAGADLGPLLGVTLLVVILPDLGAEALSTLFTLVGFVFCTVGLLVGPQLRHAREWSLPTVPAVEDLVSGVGYQVFL